MTDVLPVPLDGSEAPGWIVRRIDGVAGNVSVDIRLRAAFAFAASPTCHTPAENGGVACSRSGAARLLCGSPLERDANGGLRGRLHLRGGDRRTLVLALGDDLDTLRLPASRDEIERSVSETISGWRHWAAAITYEGHYASTVRRSALALKLLTYEPTGGLVAAVTTSLPEEIGGIRNWDYRYTWLRDAALAVDALLRLDQHGEAMAFWRWLERVMTGGRGMPCIMYAIDGREVPDERVIRGLEGYARSTPVRVGNDAARQLQLDVHGHVLDAAARCIESMAVPHPRLAPVLARLADDAAARFHDRDHGEWEVRSERRHFLDSKLLCWVALDRAIRLARGGWIIGDVGLWRSAAADLRGAILERGFDPRLGAFTRAFGASELDATGLLVSRVGFLPPSDPRVRGTVRAVQRALSENGWVRRYLGNDGLPRREGAFIMCTLWLADALALDGDIEAAASIIERVANAASDIGLLAEEVDPSSGRLLGNYPQAFSHLALIRSILTLDDACKPKPKPRGASSR